MISIREIAWLKGARKDFEEFPEDVRREANLALSAAALGRKADSAKPMKGMTGGVFEIALRYRGDAYRVIYAVQIDEALWVIHAFQKKSKSGIKTPRLEIDLIRDRLKRLQEALQ